MSMHKCHLHSYIIGAPLFVLLPIIGCIWTARAKSSLKAWLRVLMSVILVFAIQCGYQSWLHSASFPEILLSKNALESKIMREKQVK